MKDVFRNELSIGDEVAVIVPRRGALAVGTVIKCTPLIVTVSVEYPYGSVDYLVLRATQDQVVKRVYHAAAAG